MGAVHEEHETLGNNVLPMSYKLFFEPSFKTFIYKGIESIKITVKSPTSRIALNSKGIEIKSVSVSSNGHTQKASVKKYPDKERIELSFSKKISGSAVIDINFTGQNNDKLHGFYRSKYQYKGHDEYMLTTQLEPASARAAFPSFDEPAMKATFDISLMIDSDLEAISNMPQQSAVKKGKKKLVTFKTTPIMSTYLVYFGIGRFDSVTTKVGGTTLSVYTVLGKKELAHMALEQGAKLFNQLQRYFNVKYPLPKLDMIAVPDFAAGAMENWGAMTFRETALLGDEKKMSLTGKQIIAMIVAHEMAHQWFGDLVTMKWWNDMWLNESFATFMSYKAVDKVFPEWHYMDSYRDDVMADAFAADCFINTHPISMKVNTPAQIEELFDDIGYDKGGSVLFMLEGFAGAETFRKGLKTYLERHSYSNAQGTDLWNAIDYQARKEGRRLPIAKLMQQWVGKKGFPIVKVERAGNSFRIEQKRFTLSKELDDTWMVPINYIAGNKTGSLLLDVKVATIKSSSEWIKLNYGQTAFYRSAYDNTILSKLGVMVKSHTFAEVDSWGIINDLMVQVRSGRIPLQAYTNFIERYCMDVGYPANIVVATGLASFFNMSQDRPFQKIVKQTALKYFKNKLDALGWEKKEKESPSDTIMRSLTITALGRMNYEKVVEKAKELFDGYANGKPLDSNIKRAVYSTVACNYLDMKTFDRMFKLYSSERIPEDRIMALSSLGLFRDKKLSARALALSISPKVRMQDTYYPIASSSTYKGLRWDFIRWIEKKWKMLMERYASDSRTLRDLVMLFSFISDDDQYAEFKRFFSKKQNIRDDIKTELLLVSERIDANMRFIKMNSEK